jgi:hypothetical protein
MRRLVILAALFAATNVSAHPGHGRPGWLHFHEFSDGLLIVVGLAVAGLLYWAWKE